MTDDLAWQLWDDFKDSVHSGHFPLVGVVYALIAAGYIEEISLEEESADNIS